MPSRYAWSVDGGTATETPECEARVRLPEGAHHLALTVHDSGGGSDTAQVDAEVRDLIVVGLGDSFSAGSGDSRSGLVAADYDQAHCTRSGRAGQARAALEMERRDPKTSVTFIHLACGGARADLGLLGAPQQPAAADPRALRDPAAGPGRGLRLVHDRRQRRALLRDHRAARSKSPTRRSRSWTGEQTHERTQRLLLELRERLARVAACFGDGFEGRPCEVYGPSGRDDDTQVVTLPRIPLAGRANRVVQVTYPDLTTHFVGAGSRSARAGPSSARATCSTAFRTGS